MSPITSLNLLQRRKASGGQQSCPAWWSGAGEVLWLSPLLEPLLGAATRPQRTVGCPTPPSPVPGPIEMSSWDAGQI